MHLANFSRSFPNQVMSIVGRYLLSGNDTVTNYYVSTTGSDSNDGLALTRPFLTIQKAIDTVAAGLFSGKVFINVAAGTYNGNIVLKEMMGKNAYTQTSTTAAFTGPSVVEILGDAATPGNVIIIGDNTKIATVLMEQVGTTYIINGFDIRSNGASTSRAFYVGGNKSFLTINNVNTSAVGFTMFAQHGGRIIYANGSAGGTHAASQTFATIGYQGFIRIDRGVTVTGLAASAVTGSRGGYIHFNTTGQTYTFSSTSPSASSCFQPVGYGVTVLGFGSGDVINISNRTAPVFRAISGGSFNISGGATFNLTDCTGGVMRLDPTGCYQENSASTWNYLGTSVATYTMQDGSFNLSLNNFTSAVPVFSVQDTDQTFGFDWRYGTPVKGTVPGALLTAGTGFLKPMGTQATNYVPIYVAQQDEVVDKLQMVSRVGNGAAHTDTYTVYKNGVATTMVLTITNAASGSTTTNPVTLAAGDHLAILATADAASEAEDVLVQANVRKT